MLKLHINTNLDGVFWMISVIRIEAGKALDLISIQISSIWNSSDFETFTVVTQIAGSC